MTGEDVPRSMISYAAYAVSVFEDEGMARRVGQMRRHRADGSARTSRRMNGRGAGRGRRQAAEAGEEGRISKERERTGPERWKRIEMDLELDL